MFTVTYMQISVQRSRTKRRSAVGTLAQCLSVLVLSCGLTLAHSQAPTQGPDPTFSSPNAGSMSREGMSDGSGRIDSVESARRQRMQRAVIRQTIAEDMSRLLQLAQDLNDDINKERPEMLTQVELKKYAEIGKLAHRLKSEMKNYGTAGPQLQPLPGLIPAPDPTGKQQRRGDGT